MSIDNRGAECPLNALPNVGIHEAGPHVIKDSAGTAIDITGATITFTIIDGKGNNDSTPEISSYNMTITDAANGEFKIDVPASAFTHEWGEEMTYTLAIKYSGDSQYTPLIYGTLSLQEAF